MFPMNGANGVSIAKQRGAVSHKCRERRHRNWTAAQVTKGSSEQISLRLAENSKQSAPTKTVITNHPRDECINLVTVDEYVEILL
jgi:hypothetical protein